MTIDEHFLYMVFLEAIIFFIGMGMMYYQQKRTADNLDKILKEPEYATTVFANGVYGFMQDMQVHKGMTKEEVKEAEAKQQIFFGFIQTCGAAAIAGAKGHVEGAVGQAVDLPKRHPMKPFEGLINQFGGEVLQGFLKGGKKRVAKAAEEAVAEPTFIG